MNALETAILAAMQSKGGNKEVNKAYLEFIKANFMMPVEAEHSESGNPRPLYLLEKETVFLPVFSNRQVMDQWSRDIQDTLEVLYLSGVDLLKGVGEEVHICLDIGSPSYKLFLPAEIARMRSMVLKFFGE